MEPDFISCKILKWKIFVVADLISNKKIQEVSLSDAGQHIRQEDVTNNFKIYMQIFNTLIKCLLRFVINV